ncbi:MAG TPA: glycosyltransferase, partial [Candidatus Krumholzibacteria bacterium]|nr:glycosyltransferase [Candidatus Krumholzibacteria bacterium]
LIPEGVRVIRSQSIEPAAAMLRATRTRTQPAGESAATREPPAPRRKSFVRRALAGPWRAMLRVLSYPDHQIGWAPRVARDVARFVQRHPGTIVLSSTPPHSTQLGVRLARVFVDFGWVADFRDPWTVPLRQPKGRLNLAFQRAMERWVLSRCDRVIANTTGNREGLLKSFRNLDPARVETVPNAFDTDTMPPPARDDDPALACDMAYFGEVYPGMLDEYVAAVHGLVQRNAAAAPRLHVFGRVTDEDVARVARDGLAAHIVFFGVVSYTRSLALMRSARSLLLLLPEGDAMATCVPSKLYPYLFTGRPVFALVPPGDAGRVVAETGAGTVVAPGNADATAAALQSFIENVRRGHASGAPADERTHAYAMDRAALRVHEILLEVAARE